MAYPNYRYDTGLGNVGSYQVSGKPFLSGGIDADQNKATNKSLKVSFPSVTRWIYIMNHDSDSNCKIGFSEAGLAGDNFLRVPSGSQGSVRLEVKVEEIWLTGSTSVDIMAGLTGIDTNRITNSSISGSNWSGSSGVG